MTTVGIYFGTDTGATRRVAKTIAKKLGSELTGKPINIRNAEVDDLKQHQLLVIGSPTYGEGELPGKSTGNMTESWEEFLPKMAGADLGGIKVALYGLGDQEKYSRSFANAVRYIHDQFIDCGAEIVGHWEIDDNYQFKASKAAIDGRFVGLILDEDNQKELSGDRLDSWLANLPIPQTENV